MIAILMLFGAVWLAVNPQWLIDLREIWRDELRRLPRGLPWYTRSAGPLPDDRRTRMGIRLFGMLMALVAAAHLYEELVRVLANR